MPSSIPRRLRQQVFARFGNLCAYCHTPTLITDGRLVIDHVIPRARGGRTVPGNLCPACHACNESKGAQMAALDPQTGEVVPLFRPREQEWRAHFRWSDDGSTLLGQTPTGRATVLAINMNYAGIVEARQWWARVGWHPPLADL